MTLVDLSSRRCRWPVETPEGEAQLFCGAPKGSAGPYCERHAERAPQSRQPKLMGSRFVRAHQATR